jgi:1-acyl-sn-glycerol-3-phosphate acyltransferase
MINRLCRLIFFKWLGWRQIGSVPTDKKYLFVALPHTSNWDFVYGWLAIRSLDLNVTIFAKDVFFVWPITYICRFFGVAPVNRRKSTNFVDSIARQYAEHDELAALITPEGTRKFQPRIKSGYYYLAKEANIPIVVAGPDYANKTFTLLPAREPFPTFEEDAAQLIEFCTTMTAKKPDYTFTANSDNHNDVETK